MVAENRVSQVTESTACSMAATELALISGFKGRLCAFSYFYDNAVLIWLLIFHGQQLDPEGPTTSIHRVGKH